MCGQPADEGFGARLSREPRVVRSVSGSATRSVVKDFGFGDMTSRKFYSKNRVYSKTRVYRYSKTRFTRTAHD